MKGHLIIGKNYSFYNINNNLIKVEIRGNSNKVINPHRITDLIINGNKNNIEIIGGGKIINIKLFGNNNKIFIKNNCSQPNYIDNGLGNQLIRDYMIPPPLLPPQNIIFHQPIYSQPVNINLNLGNNNANNVVDKLEKATYSNLPTELKTKNLICILCNLLFMNFEEVVIFSCKNHVFHGCCLKNKIRSQIGTPKCPACNQDFKSNNDNNNNNNLTISPPPYSPIRPLPLNINNRNPFLNYLSPNNQNRHRYRLHHIRPLNPFRLQLNHDDDIDDDFYANPFHQRLDILDRLENLSLNDSFDDLDFEGPGLDKNILDNMEIAKIKDVDKLDNDKKKCTICLENYVNGDNTIALPCIHIFHADCIKTWLKNKTTCPMCKYEIKYENEGFNEINENNEYDDDDNDYDEGDVDDFFR